MSTDKERVRTLNDHLRQTMTGGHAVITPGIAALGQEAVERLIKVISVFDDFCAENDPHEEHDFGAFKFDEAEVVFKIDYYDRDLQYHSPNPADPNVTMRVITLMRLEEY